MALSVDEGRVLSVRSFTDSIRDGLYQLRPIIPNITNGGTHLPRLHFLCGVGSEQIHGEQRRFTRLQQSLRIVPVEYDRHSIVNWLDQLIGGCCDDGVGL